MIMIKCSPDAFAKCKTKCHHCRSEDAAFFLEGSDCDKFNKEVAAAPQTNADRIRSMTDEELANLLLDGCRGSKCEDQPQNDFGSVNCRDCRMRWLQQPAK